jgi:hypothetical protein
VARRPREATKRKPEDEIQGREEISLNPNRPRGVSFGNESIFSRPGPGVQLCTEFRMPVREDRLSKAKGLCRRKAPTMSRVPSLYVCIFQRSDMHDAQTISRCDSCLGECESIHKHMTECGDLIAEFCCVCIAETAPPIPYESICDVCADRIRGGYVALNLKVPARLLRSLRSA